MKAACSRLEAYGIKPSVQRMAIMDYLMRHKTHPTADAIYDALCVSMPTLSRTTVYNTLALFAGKGAAVTLDFDPKRAHYDGDIAPHAHFFCTACRAIFDIPMPAWACLRPDDDILRGASAQSLQLSVKGLCGMCAASAEKTE